MAILFLNLDLLKKQAFDCLVTHHYRHDTESRGFLEEFPLHNHTKPLAVMFHDYWPTQKLNFWSASDTLFGKSTGVLDLT